MAKKVPKENIDHVYPIKKDTEKKIPVEYYRDNASERRSLAEIDKLKPRKEKGGKKKKKE